MFFLKIKIIKKKYYHSKKWFNFAKIFFLSRKKILLT